MRPIFPLGDLWRGSALLLVAILVACLVSFCQGARQLSIGNDVSNYSLCLFVAVTNSVLTIKAFIMLIMFIAVVILVIHMYNWFEDYV